MRRLPGAEIRQIVFALLADGGEPVRVDRAGVGRIEPLGRTLLQDAPVKRDPLRALAVQHPTL